MATDASDLSVRANDHALELITPTQSGDLVPRASLKRRLKWSEAGGSNTRDGFFYCNLLARLRIEATN